MRQNAIQVPGHKAFTCGLFSQCFQVAILVRALDEIVGIITATGEKNHKLSKYLLFFFFWKSFSVSHVVGDALHWVLRVTDAHS